jgi:hypothetical protein
MTNTKPQEEPGKKANLQRELSPAQGVIEIVHTVNHNRAPSPEEIRTRTEKTLSYICRALRLSKRKADLEQAYTASDPDSAIHGPEIVKLTQTVTLLFFDRKVTPKMITGIIPEGADFLKPFTEAPEIRDLVTVSYYRALYEEGRVLQELLKGLLEEERKRTRELQEERDSAQDKKPRKSYRLSSHLSEQIVKGPQLSLFEQALQEVSSEPASKKIYLDLNTNEQMVVLALGKALHLLSQTDSPEAPDYYMGNRDEIPQIHQTPTETKHPVVKDDEYTTLPVPQIMTSTQMVAREYMGGVAPSGADKRTVEKLLRNLATRHFKISYVKKSTLKDRHGKPVIREQAVAQKRPLIFIDTYTDKRTPEGGPSQEKKKLLVTFNPVFIDEIQTKYSEFPEDYIKRLRENWPGRTIPKVLLQLGLYLNQVRSGRNNNLEPHEIYIPNLMNKLDPANYKIRKTQTVEQVQACLDCCIKCGFISSWKKGPGATGELKYFIYINKKW